MQCSLDEWELSSVRETDDTVRQPEHEANWGSLGLEATDALALNSERCLFCVPREPAASFPKTRI